MPKPLIAYFIIEIIVVCPKYMEQEEKKNNIELAFPKYEQEENDGEFISKGGTGGGLVKHLSTSTDQITEWFKQYQVESIELLISGLIETGGIISLLFSAKGEGGLRVVLKRRAQTT